MLWNVDPAARTGLADQIAANVRRGLIEGELRPGDALPSSAELARLLGVNANTVLAAYRGLRDDGLLDFRRGRGVRVRSNAGPETHVLAAARAFADLAARFGYSADELPALLERAVSTG